MNERVRLSRLAYVLGILCVVAIVAAILLVGPPSSQSSGQTNRIITAQRGVVQSTVSGSGNIQATSQLDLGFKTSGVVSAIHVAEDSHVTTGQLVAELDPESAEVTLEQAQANLQAAEAKLAEEEATNGAGSAATGSTASQTGRVAGASQGSSSPSSSPSESSSVSAATRGANIASAKAAVRSDALTVRGDEQALANTKLYAPEDGTIVSLAGEVGETVSGTGTTRSSTSSNDASGSGSDASAASLDGSSGSGGSTSSTGSSSSSNSSFAVLSDLSSMELVVALSESEIGNVKVGQPATVTIEALESRKLAAHVVSVATLPTSSSGVVSYDVTFHLDQTTHGLKPGMSATAEVVVKQAEGVNVPTTAISGGSVTVIRNGKQVRQSVVTGLAGDSSTIISSGLNAGEQVSLPIARASSSAASALSSRFGARAGASGTLGGGGGGAAFFSGGAGFRGR